MPADQTIHRVQRHLADHAYRADGEQRLLSSWHTESVQALAGIAKPERFFAALQRQGLTLQHTQALPDHDSLDDVAIDAQHGDWLCTEKDAVKLWPRHPDVWAVPLCAELPVSLQSEVDAWLRAHPRPVQSTPTAPL